MRRIAELEEGTFGFRAGERTFEGAAGAFVFVLRGLEHAYWNVGTTQAKMLISFERYFEESAEGLEAAADEQAAMGVRKALSEKYDVEVGPTEASSGPSRWAPFRTYSPNLVEGQFSEVRMQLSA